MFEDKDIVVRYTTRPGYTNSLRESIVLLISHYDIEDYSQLYINKVAIIRTSLNNRFFSKFATPMVIINALLGLPNV